MVYRSSRRQAEQDSEPEAQTLQEFSPERKDVSRPGDLRRQKNVWRTAAIFLGCISIGLLIGLIVVLSRQGGGSLSHVFGGLRNCGTHVDNPNFVDLSEPSDPGPFHDLTKHEINKLIEFLSNDPDFKITDPKEVTLSSSYLYILDLIPPKKKDVLKFLDANGDAPERKARAVIFRGDLDVPVIEEYGCGPLPDVSSCRLLQSDKRRNPTEFTLRPFGTVEFDEISKSLFPQIDKKLGYMLKDLYGTSYTNCLEPVKCFKIYPSPMASGLVGDINKRRAWVWAEYPLEYYVLHPVDFGVLLNLDSAKSSDWIVDKVWFRGNIYTNMDEVGHYYNTTARGTLKKMRPQAETDHLYSSMKRHGDPLPAMPLRPPTLVEPDGKRYSMKDRKVEYLGWSFNFRMSALTGPALYDIRYKGERIAYELSFAEVSVFYSADNPIQRVTDFVDSGALIGIHSKSLVPGGDCPDTATFINQTFVAQAFSGFQEIGRAFCMFENNNGFPLRRHLSFSQSEGAFYNGMLDSALTLRAALTILNYDYITDFIFHQNGAIETRVMSTGFIYPSFYSEMERPYGFQIAENVLGSLHHHMFHYKVDLDISGTSNRYETLNFKPTVVDMRAIPGRKYHMTKYERSLKKTEKAALYKYNFDTPRYHVIHNDAAKTPLGEIKAFRIDMQGMSKTLIPEGVDNEVTVPWARHQLVVTKHKDDEQVSSSPYAMWDSFNPVTDFSKYYEDDENIVDEDLVVWLTMGMHHLPHTEDLPVTPTVGNHLKFFLLPYNYYTGCPSMASRDQIRIQLKDPKDPKQGVKVERNGLKDETCAIPQVASEYDRLVEENPDLVLESRKVSGLF